jgi:hypothetical protein
MASTMRFGPATKDYRPLRWLETCPDNYVAFAPKQKQFAFSYRHPVLWKGYVALAKARCALLGHEFSTLWEADKFVPDPKTRTNCLFCGHEVCD